MWASSASVLLIVSGVMLSTTSCTALYFIEDTIARRRAELDALPVDEPVAQLLSPTCEPTLRHVIEVHRHHWACLRYRKKVLDDFFAEARKVGQAPRVSKRQRVAPTFADEEDASRPPLPRHHRAPTAKKRTSPAAKAAARMARVARVASREQAAADGRSTKTP